MTVKELIEVLKTFPETAGVYRKSDLDGIYEVTEVYDNDITETDHKDGVILD